MSRKSEAPPSLDETGEPFGNLLKERRLAQDISLDEAAARTRIRLNFLEAMEEDRFGALPGETYVYGFLRTYAAYLGLDADDMVAAYNQRCHSTQVAPPPSEEDREGAGFSLSHPRMLLAIALLALTAILAVSAFRFSRHGPEVASDSGAGGAEPAVESPLAGGEDGLFPADFEEAGAAAGLPVAEADPAMVAPGGGQEDQPRVVPLVFVPTGGGMLEAESLGSGWLEITIDDRPTQRYQLEPNVVLKWRIGETFHLETERSGLLSLQLGGRRIDLGERTALHVGPAPDAGRE